MAADNGDPKLESTKTLHINIGDVNDNPPKFLRRDYQATIVEDLESGSEVIPTGIIAVDPDIGQNGCFNYSLEDDYSGQFMLEQVPLPSTDISSNGCEAKAVIRLAKGLDADGELGQDTYKLTIHAKDAGEPSQSDFTVLTIKVGDVNDNKPIFTTSTYVFNASELTKIGDVIGQVVAFDADKDEENSRINYSWSGDTGHTRSPFALDTDTGEISTTDDLDAEVWQENNHWNFEITAKDHGMPQKSSVAQVTINLMDENDNAPRFISPNPKTEVTKINDGVEVNDIILRKIEAIDEDATKPNNQFYFQLGKCFIIISAYVKICSVFDHF